MARTKATAVPESAKPSVFVSYSHADEDDCWKKGLKPHLGLLEKAGRITLWDDRKIDPGGKWHEEIQEALDRPSIAVCLITANYLDSDFCVKEEIPHILERYERDGLIFLPLLLRQCTWRAFEWLSETQMLPRDARSVLEDFQGRESVAFAEIGNQILSIVDDPDYEELRDPALKTLLEKLARDKPGLCLITTRERLTDLAENEPHGVVQHGLDQVSREAGRALLRVGGVRGSDAELEAVVGTVGGHALAVNLLATYVADTEGRRIDAAGELPEPDPAHEPHAQPRRVIEGWARRLGPSPELELLHQLGLFDRPASGAELEALRRPPPVQGINRRLQAGGYQQAVARLRVVAKVSRHPLHHLSLGSAHLQRGDRASAELHLRQAVDGLRRAGGQEFIPRALLARAELHLATGDPDRARADLDESLTLCTRIGLRLLEADTWLGFTRLHLATGAVDDARTALGRASAIIEETGYNRRLAELAELEARVAAAEGGKGSP